MFVLSGCNLGFLWDWCCWKDWFSAATSWFPGPKDNSYKQCGLSLTSYSFHCRLHQIILISGFFFLDVRPRMCCDLNPGDIWAPFSPRYSLTFHSLSPASLTHCLLQNLAKLKKNRVLYSLWKFDSLVGFTFSGFILSKDHSMFEGLSKPQDKVHQNNKIDSLK